MYRTEKNASYIGYLLLQVEESSFLLKMNHRINALDDFMCDLQLMKIQSIERQNKHSFTSECGILYFNFTFTSTNGMNYINALNERMNKYENNKRTQKPADRCQV